jgi:hypothetical protein
MSQLGYKSFFHLLPGFVSVIPETFAAQRFVDC